MMVTLMFLGSRSVPGVYGIDPKHLLLENDGTGNFNNSTDKRPSNLILG
jgi:hypothetical protein